MANAVDFNGSNKTFNAPEGRDDVIPLKAFVNGHTLITCWELTPEEREEVQRTGRVFVSQLCGNTLFPMFVGGRAAVREMAVEYGSKTIPQED